MTLRILAIVVACLLIAVIFRFGWLLAGCGY